MKGISIVGSTGSIGTQALDVMALHPERFEVVALCAYQKADVLFEQVRRFRPEMAGLVVPPEAIPEDLRDVRWVFGPECRREAARHAQAEAVLVSVVGADGLGVVLDALGAQKTVLLANKEALVAGGALVMDAVGRSGQRLLPVDSEHSAIFQCLEGAGPNPPTRLLLTASGGPFRTWDAERIAQATPEMALRHPNWAMGPKITVDSASMMNKALEVIEAHWLFGLAPEQIEVVVHPQSIIHSMVEYADGAVLAQLGAPDMRVPILYAMSYPERLETGAQRLDFAALGTLSFEAPDLARFPMLRLGYEALRAGGTAPAVLNAANEVTVRAFLAGGIAFGRMPALVEGALAAVPRKDAGTLEQVLTADLAARAYVTEILEREGLHP